MSSIRTQRGLVITLLLLLGVGMRFLLAIGPPAQEDHVMGTGNGFSPAALAAFRAMSLPARPLPARLRRELDADLGSESRALDPSDSRKVAAHAWLVGGRGVVCLVADPSGAAACSGDRRFTRRGLFLGTFQATDREHMPTDFSVLGAVPDWVAAVEIEIGKHRSIQPVRENVVRFRANSPILVRRLVAEGERPSAEPRAWG
jgi:hypothetical protein